MENIVLNYMEEIKVGTMIRLKERGSLENRFYVLFDFKNSMDPTNSMTFY